MKYLKTAATLVYSLLLIYIVFFARRRWNIDARSLNFIPLRSTIEGYQQIDTYDSKELKNYVLQVLGNIALFMPVPVILMSRFKIRDNKSVIIISFFISLGIEIVQYIFKAGVADIDDIILNSTGTIIGCIFYSLFLRISTRNRYPLFHQKLSKRKRKGKKFAKNR